MSDLIQGHFPQPPASAGHYALIAWERMVARNWRQDVPRQVLAKRYGKSGGELAAIAARYVQCVTNPRGRKA